MFQRFSNHIITLTLLVLTILPGLILPAADDNIVPQSRILLYAILLKIPLLAVCLALSRGRNVFKRLKILDFPLILGISIISVGIGFMVPGKVLWTMDEGSMILLQTFVLLILSVFSEELVFRFWIIETYQKEFKPIPVAVLASFLFASIHLWQGPWAVIYSFAIGMIYSLVFIRYRNIWIPISAHLIHNLLAVGLTYV